ncbi:MAG TPA: lipid-transfer protein [Mycobacteriales bacterium]|nr:lipid-transfer protein [Mycobacteriales bacterium]
MTNRRTFNRPVAIIGSAEFRTPVEPERNEVEMLMPVVHEALADAGIKDKKKEIGFTVSGSSDYLQGFPFAFVGALDAIGAWPPIMESHVEMDGAFAFAEAVEVLQHGPEVGGADTALVYAFSRPSRSANADRTLALQLDPYLVAPLWPGQNDLAGLQAQAMRDSGKFADVPAVEPTHVEDGAVALVLAVGERAEQASKKAWVTGVDHRIEAPALGVRDLTTSTASKLAAEGAGALDGTIDAAWLHVLYSYQELLLREAFGLNGQPVDSDAGPIMVGGLQRIAEAFKAVSSGTHSRVLAHAQSGACLQQSFVTVLEAQPSPKGVERSSTTPGGDS